MSTLSAAIQAALDADLGTLPAGTPATARSELSTALASALDPYFIHADGSNGPATPTVRGAVKVDTLVSDPIVYIEATVDALLALKLNLAGGTMSGAITGGTASSAQSSSAFFRARVNGDTFEFGHTNTAGYGSAIGVEASSGASYLAFNAQGGTTANTYRTHGLMGSVLRGDLAGGFGWYKVPGTNADNQALTLLAALDQAGTLTVAGNIKLLGSSAQYQFSNNDWMDDIAGFVRFLTSAGGAMPVKMGGLVVSNSYSDTVSTPNVYVQGSITAGNAISTGGTNGCFVWADRDNSGHAYEIYGISGFARFWTAAFGDTATIGYATGAWNFAVRPTYGGGSLALLSEVLGTGGGTLTGNLFVAGDEIIRLGVNSSGGYLDLGGNSRPSTNASLAASNGNVFLDSKDGAAGVYATYIGYYNANELQLATGGGNVRIGTSGSAFRLTVNGDIYATGGWVRTDGARGLYNQSYDTYWFSENASYWVSKSDFGLSIRNRTGIQKGYVYFDSSGFGLLDSTGAWAVQVHTGTQQGGVLYAVGAGYYWDVQNARPYSTYNSASYVYAGVQVRELNLASAQTGVWSEAPRIAFHWGGRVANQIGMDATGMFSFLNSDTSGLVNTMAGTVYSGGTTAYYLSGTTWNASEVIADNWLRPVGVTGMYWQTYGGHLYRSESAYQKVACGGASDGGLKLYKDYETGFQGAFYYDGSGVGLINDQGSWAVRCNFGTSLGGVLAGQWEVTGNIIGDADIYLGTRGVWLSSWLNQDVRPTAAPTFVSVKTVTSTTAFANTPATVLTATSGAGVYLVYVYCTDAGVDLMGVAVYTYDGTRGHVSNVVTGFGLNFQASTNVLQSYQSGGTATQNFSVTALKIA